MIPLGQEALRLVQPSAKREGFATIPDVTWEDVGALKGVREELTMAILVSQHNLSREKIPARTHRVQSVVHLSNPMFVLGAWKVG